MNTQDSLLQKHMPTVMVPKYEDLAPCDQGMTRLLRGHSGLYLETRQRWGRLVRMLWQSDRNLPYGDVEEIDEFQAVLDKIWPIIEDEMVSDAIDYVRQDKEWFGYIILTPDGYKYYPVKFKSTAGSARYERPKLPPDCCYVVDVHSHDKIPPFFSPTDNEDDKGGVGIKVVLGNFKPVHVGSQYTYEWVSRYSIEGFHFEGGDDGLN